MQVIVLFSFKYYFVYLYIYIYALLRCQLIFVFFFVRLTESSGSLTDGPVNYKYKTKCTWLIEGYPNAVLRLSFNHFATECSWDHMYVFDGDSIYAPLVADSTSFICEYRYTVTMLSHTHTHTYIYIYIFPDHSSPAVFFRINSCPNNCSGHGRCTTGNSISSSVYCECERYWKGEACDIPYCWDDCGSPDRGYCDLTGEKLCVCNDSWQGEGQVIVQMSFMSLCLPNGHIFFNNVNVLIHYCSVTGQ
uniref:EGF-like domain-containing protein n=1 Tax=Sinocyclocheilus grahami TaxID=75366 RepID=A0A672L2Y1_SINGR